MLAENDSHVLSVCVVTFRMFIMVIVTGTLLISLSGLCHPALFAIFVVIGIVVTIIYKNTFELRIDFRMKPKQR